MAWVAPDMSDRISIDDDLQITDQGMRLGQCVRINGVWIFLLANRYFPHLVASQNLHRKLSAPYVVKFIDEQLALLNIAEKLKS